VDFWVSILDGFLTDDKDFKKIRLQKILSEFFGVSRRKAEVLITEKKVVINGKTAELGDKADLKAKICVLGKQLNIDNRVQKRYIALYKTKGYITTTNDEKNRKTILDLVKFFKERLYPIGRLDKDSEGLILLTNDGEFANSVMHPSKKIKKTYEVVVNQRVSKKQLEGLKNPSTLLKQKLQKSQVCLAKNFLNKSKLIITLKEGKNRQIRRACEALNLKVLLLKRVSIGGLKLKNLKPGNFLELSYEKIKRLIEK
jgi:23S rRNA pseudouridine2605 synthase